MQLCYNKLNYHILKGEPPFEQEQNAKTDAAEHDCLLYRHGVVLCRRADSEAVLSCRGRGGRPAAASFGLPLGECPPPPRAQRVCADDERDAAQIGGQRGALPRRADPAQRGRASVAQQGVCGADERQGHPFCAEYHGHPARLQDRMADLRQDDLSGRAALPRPPLPRDGFHAALQGRKIRCDYGHDLSAGSDRAFAGARRVHPLASDGLYRASG